MKHVVDVEHWDRRDNWRFMREFANSWYAVTTEVDCTFAWQECKERHTSFFIRYLYAMLHAANAIREFGYRPDGSEGVVWFDQVGATVPVAVEGGTFHTVLVDYIADYVTFYANTRHLLTHLPEVPEPYGVNQRLIESGETGVINISATPQLYFTSMTYTFHRPGLGSDWPLMNVGKVVEREGRKVMPVGVYVDHCFVDGSHISQFINMMQDILNTPTPEVQS